MGQRSVKKKYLGLLLDGNLEQAKILIRQESSLVINPLISFLCNVNPQVKWGAVTLVGMIGNTMALENMESVRIVMRRLMWSLNDESGGIGWGAPEAMAEIMVNNAAVADEYSHMLVAYMREDGFYLELESLQRGLLWAVGRLASERRTHLLSRQASRYMLPYFSSNDSTVCGLAAYAAGHLQSRAAVEPLQTLLDDRRSIDLYDHEKLLRISVGELAHNALQRIHSSSHLRSRPIEA